MQTIQLSAQSRSILGKKVKALRQQEIVPGVMYGHGQDNQNVMVPRKQLQMAYDKAGESTLIDLEVDQQTPVKVIIHNAQHDGVTGKLLHVDFYQVNMKEKITTEVPLQFVGESTAVKQLGGVLVKSLNKVEVEALPADLPHQIIVDISGLNTFEDKIIVADINIPHGVSLKAEPTEAVVLVEPPRSEEELKALESTVTQDVSQVEVLTEKKEEGEEAEGPAAEGQGKTEEKPGDKK